MRCGSRVFHASSAMRTFWPTGDGNLCRAGWLSLDMPEPSATADILRRMSCALWKANRAGGFGCTEPSSFVGVA